MDEVTGDGILGASYRSLAPQPWLDEQMKARTTLKLEGSDNDSLMEFTESLAPHWRRLKRFIQGGTVLKHCATSHRP